MIMRSLDENNDWNFGRGSQDFLTGLAACELNLKTRLKEWVGDCFWSLTSGIDYNNYLDIGTKSLLDLNINRVILQSDGVIQFADYVSILNIRALTVTCNVQTVFGKLDLSFAQETTIA